MPRTRDEILSDALQLPEDDRAVLADLIYGSLEASVPGEESVDQEWQAEIQRRVEDIDQGRVELVSWEDLASRLRTSKH